MTENEGFLASLFDFGFTEFVTTRVIKLLYLFAVIASAISALAMVIRGFGAGFGTGLLSLILSPLVFGLCVLMSRIWCELVMVVFKIADNTSRTGEQGKP